MPATLKLTRTSIVLELRRKTFDVLVDDERAGSVDSKQSIEISVEPGHHSLRVEEGRYRSREVTVDLGDGEVVGFRCSGARIWPIWLASFAVPSLALTLKRE
jgi:PEGA domain